MKPNVHGLALAAAIALGLAAQADEVKDKGQDGVAEALSKLAQLGPGVHAIKKDRQGRITSCVVVGQARISTVLGKAKGLEIARQRADLNAKSQFARWLKESVSVHLKAEDETIFFLEGGEDNDKDAVKEAGKAVEKTSTKMESLAQGLVRGFQVLHAEQSGKDKSYTLVMGWEAKTAEGTKRVRAINESDKVGSGAAVKARSGDHDPGKPSGSKMALDKKVEDKKVTSPEAKKFLP